MGKGLAESKQGGEHGATQAQFGGSPVCFDFSEVYGRAFLKLENLYSDFWYRSLDGARAIEEEERQDRLVC